MNAPFQVDDKGKVRFPMGIIELIVRRQFEPAQSHPGAALAPHIGRKGPVLAPAQMPNLFRR
jgi:hypothetical protein